MKQLVALLACIPIVLVLSCVSVDRAEKYPNMVADMDPVSAGSIDAEFDRMFSSKVNKADVAVIFYPRENTVALEFRYEFVRYRQFWDEPGRRQFVAALERYKKDYAARNLVTKYGKSRSVYGKVNGRVDWETFKYTTTHISAPTIELGYRFKGETPFFATLQRSARDESGGQGESNKLESLQINMYFTRAQAEDLVKLFDQSYLLGLLGAKAVPDPETPALDNYREHGE
jgi:hypothetical protein